MKTDIILPAFLFAAMATSFQAGASTYELQSPDGKTVVTVSLAVGRL